MIYSLTLYKKIAARQFHFSADTSFSFTETFKTKERNDPRIFMADNLSLLEAAEKFRWLLRDSNLDLKLSR